MCYTRSIVYLPLHAEGFNSGVYCPGSWTVAILIQECTVYYCICTVYFLIVHGAFRNYWHPSIYKKNNWCFDFRRTFMFCCCCFQTWKALEQYNVSYTTLISKWSAINILAGQHVHGSSSWQISNCEAFCYGTNSAS